MILVIINRYTMIWVGTTCWEASAWQVLLEGCHSINYLPSFSEIVREFYGCHWAPHNVVTPGAVWLPSVRQFKGLSKPRRFFRSLTWVKALLLVYADLCSYSKILVADLPPASPLPPTICIYHGWMMCPWAWRWYCCLGAYSSLLPPSMGGVPSPE